MASLTPAVATRLEKVAVDNGFDLQLQSEGPWLGFASSQAPLRIWLTAPDDLLCVAALSMRHVATGLREFGEAFGPPLPAVATAARVVTGFPELHRLVRRAFQLSRTLPDALLRDFERRTSGLPRATEIERLVVQRVGQEVFREGVLEYWQGRCAVTGVANPELLRASHIKSWASCETDAERLDVFNGLLLTPNLDAAFDRGLITFSGDGDLTISPLLTAGDRHALLFHGALRIHGLTAAHQEYLSYHRRHVFRQVAPAPTLLIHPASKPSVDDVPSTALFDRYIGIDYSGAETPTSGLPGLRVYVATPGETPTELRPGGHWTRRRLAEWLVEQLQEGPRSIVGIDHCFSLPLAYFNAHGLPHRWAQFLEDFREHWPTDGDNVYVDFVRKGILGNGAARQGNTRWRRVTEIRAGGAKSAFHFDVPGSVAKSTHSGLPWLRYIRDRLGDRVHFWPFDGWEVPLGRSVIAEVYPALWRGRFPLAGASPDQEDAYAVAAWLREGDSNRELHKSLTPSLSELDRATAVVEGWILGV